MMDEVLFIYYFFSLIINLTMKQIYDITISVL